METIFGLTIQELAQHYRTKELSPVEVLDRTFKRLEKMEPHLNAFITILKEEAYELAYKAERIFLEGESAHILCGVPYTVKDLYYTQGIKTTCGSRILKDFVPNETSALIKKLASTGAILIGKTNMLEFAYGIVHDDYGQTNNPYDYSKTAGGSSGGSAAAVAAGIGWFSLGSDTGGSIRIPASYCGIAGLKPTYGLLNMDGVFPLSQSLDHAGPMARSVGDIQIVMSVLADEKSTIPQKYHSPVIGVLPDSLLTNVSDDVKDIYQKCLTRMTSLGWDLRTVEFKYFHRAEEIIMNILLPEAAVIHEKWWDLKADYAPLTYHQIEMGINHLSTNYVKAMQELQRCKENVTGLLQDVDFLFMPTVPYPAPEEDPALESDNEMLFTGIFNITGHPALSLQAGFSKDGLPIGMQIIGDYLSENHLLQVANKLEIQN